eukprot:m.301695 g.301695  ORF g.301695 m.301695 type:complete len:110 (-) comp16428_c0_seq23:155-484(-)
MPNISQLTKAQQGSVNAIYPQMTMIDKKKYPKRNLKWVDKYSGQLFQFLDESSYSLNSKKTHLNNFARVLEEFPGTDMEFIKELDKNNGKDNFLFMNPSRSKTDNKSEF